MSLINSLVSEIMNDGTDAGLQSFAIGSELDNARAYAIINDRRTQLVARAEAIRAEVAKTQKAARKAQKLEAEVAYYESFQYNRDLLVAYVKKNLGSLLFLGFLYGTMAAMMVKLVVTITG